MRWLGQRRIKGALVIGPGDTVIVQINAPVIDQEQADEVRRQFSHRLADAIVIPLSLTLAGVQRRGRT